MYVEVVLNIYPCVRKLWTYTIHFSRYCARRERRVLRRKTCTHVKWKKLCFTCTQCRRIFSFVFVDFFCRVLFFVSLFSYITKDEYIFLNVLAFNKLIGNGQRFSLNFVFNKFFYKIHQGIFNIIQERNETLWPMLNFRNW